MTVELIVITIGSFCAGFVNAAFATGGVYITLLASLSVLPVSAAVPLQSVFATGSLIARIALFWKSIDWRLVGMFLLGCTLGVYAGARTFASLSDSLILLLLGCVLILLVWLPLRRLTLTASKAFAPIGLVHGFVGTLFGVGGVLQATILRTPLNKVQITGTLAASMLLLDVMKVSGYIALGFSYFDYVPHILLATAAGFLGVWSGKHFTHRISEQLFRKVFKIIITIVGVRLIYKGM